MQIKTASLKITNVGTLPRLLLWLFVVSHLIVGCSDREALLQPLGAQDTILAFGDSLTYGTGAPRAGSYPAALQRLTGISVINAGIPGEISATGKRRLPTLLDRHQPSLLILCHGGNDILRRMDRKAMQQNIEDMIDMAQQRGIHVILLGVPDFSLFLSAADQYDDIAAKYRLAYLPDTLPDILRRPALKADQIHPNAEGYRQMAQSIYELLLEQNALAEK